MHKLAQSAARGSNAKVDCGRYTTTSWDRFPTAARGGSEADGLAHSNPSLPLLLAALLDSHALSSALAVSALSWSHTLSAPLLRSRDFAEGVTIASSYYQISGQWQMATTHRERGREREKKSLSILHTLLAVRQISERACEIMRPLSIQYTPPFINHYFYLREEETIVNAQPSLLISNPWNINCSRTLCETLAHLALYLPLPLQINYPVRINAQE